MVLRESRCCGRDAEKVQRSGGALQISGMRVRPAGFAGRIRVFDYGMVHLLSQRDKHVDNFRRYAYNVGKSG